MCIGIRSDMKKPPDGQRDASLSSRNSNFTTVAIAAVIFTILLLLLNQYEAERGQNDRIDELHEQLDELQRIVPLQRRLPDCIIIGARKSGTRALLDLLQTHPDIETSREEVHFFDQNDTFARGYDWYRLQMPLTRAGQRTVEKTPGYLTSAVAPARVAAMNASTRLVLIVREPVTRLISDYTQVDETKKARGKGHGALEQLALDERGRLNAAYKPVRNSLYALHVRRWLQHFPLSSILLLDGDRFIVEPLAEARRVERFLGLRSVLDDRHLYFNATKGFYCFRTHEQGSPRCLGDSKGRPQVPVSAATRDTLRRLFRPHNRQFFRTVHRVFDNW